MKGVCLVICLMLARDIAGSIFRPQFDPRMANLVVQPLELLGNQRTIEEYQQHHHQQHQHQHQHPRHHAVSSESSQSQESKEPATYDDMTSDYLQSPNSPIHIWNSALYSAVIGQDKERQANGDDFFRRIKQYADAPVPGRKDYEKSSIFYDAFTTMKHMSDEEKKRFHEAYQTAVQSSKDDVHLDAPQLLKKHNYEVEEHTVKTDDGYFLKLFRIPAKQHQQQQQQQSAEAQKAPVVFLMHGLLGSADDWLLMGPGKSLAYLLSDSGFDVWLGNARGNKYSRNHVSKHPAQPDFWQFTTDEIALHDLPAMIDYTLNKTQQPKLVYVGHSQGTTAFFALASTRPEYNDKIAMMYAISPMAYMSNVRSPLLRMIAASNNIQADHKDLLGQGEFNPNKILVHLAGGNMCEYEIGCPNVCSDVYFVMTGVNPENVDVSLIPVIKGHLPAGTSIRQMKQYGQAVATHEFRKYDYGSDINEKVYGQQEPPKYDMTKVQVPVALYYSEKDWLAHPKDVEKLRQELPDVRDTYKVPEQQFTHMDFQFSKKAPEVVYKRLIESIKKTQE